MLVMFRFAFRNIFRHRSRTFLTIAAIVLGVTGIILSGGFIEDIFKQLSEATIHSRFGHIQIARQGFFSAKRADSEKFVIENPGGLISSVRKIPRVTDVLIRMRFTGLANNGRADIPIIGQGVEPGKESRLGTFLSITAGRQLTVDDAYGILLGEGVANGLKVGPGDFVTLLVNTPDGALNSLDFEVIGVFRTFSKDYDDRAVRIPLEAARDLLGSSGGHTLVLVLSDTGATDRVLGLLQEMLAGKPLEVRAWYDLADFYRKTVDMYKRQFGVLQLIILFMVVLSVANSVNMAIFERFGEFGTQMALGDRGTDIFRLILAENMLLGLLGAAAGVAVGSGLAWAISQVGVPMPPPPNSNAGFIASIRIVPSVLATAFAVGFLAAVFAAVLPARRASRLSVVEALRQNV